MPNYLRWQSYALSVHATTFFDAKGRDIKLFIKKEGSIAMNERDA